MKILSFSGKNKHRQHSRGKLKLLRTFPRYNLYNFLEIKFAWQSSPSSFYIFTSLDINFMLLLKCFFLPQFFNPQIKTTLGESYLIYRKPSSKTKSRNVSLFIYRKDPPKNIYGKQEINIFHSFYLFRCYLIKRTFISKLSCHTI